MKSEDVRDHKRVFIERIKENSGKFTPSDHRIAEYLILSYPGSLLQNASEIASKIGINIATVSRFFPKIGYKSIRDARAIIKNDIDFIENSPLDRFQQRKNGLNSESRVIKETLERDYQNIKTTFDGITDDDVKVFSERIIKAESVYIFGGQKPFSLAYYLYIQLNLIRENVYLIQPENITGYFINFKPQDALILFDFRRYFTGNKVAAEFVSEHGGAVYSFTDSPLSPSAKYADLLFTINTRGISIFDSYTAGITLLNIIVTQLINDSEETTRRRQGEFENLYQHFGIFSSLKR